MAVFIIYLVIFTGGILYNGFFNFFKDPFISRKQFAVIFILKALAVPVFYFVYSKVYGGIENFDAGKFYNDASVINEYGKQDPDFFFRLMLGMQNDQPGSADYINCLSETLNWDNGELKNYLYNDNRVVTRIHAFLHFFAFNSYFAHALFSCLLSLIGITALYRAFREFFPGKELLMVLIMCFLPALWFYTGALLKEGITIFVMGCLCLESKKLIHDKISFARICFTLFLVFLAVLLKPYILLFAVLCFFLFFLLQKYFRIKYKTGFFLMLLSLFIFIADIFSLSYRGKSLAAAAIEHQLRFADAAKGGIFLLDDKKFVRLPYDTTLVLRVPGKDEYTIKKNTPFIYWLLTDTHDTLYMSSNTDTVTRYSLAYKIAESRSNIDPEQYNKGSLALIGTCYYYTFFHPLFFNARSLLQLLASFENLALIISFIIIFSGMIFRKKTNFLPVVFLSVALLVCLLIGITTPNSGAIFRYRAPAVIYIVLAALYYLPPPGKKTERSI